MAIALKFHASPLVLPHRLFEPGSALSVGLSDGGKELWILGAGDAKLLVDTQGNDW